MTKPNDLAGRAFGQLTALAKVPSDNRGKAQWTCVCTCGKPYVALAQNLLSGATQRCADCRLHGRKAGIPNVAKVERYLVKVAIGRRYKALQTQAAGPKIECASVVIDTARNRALFRVAPGVRPADSAPCMSATLALMRDHKLIGDRGRNVKGEPQTYLMWARDQGVAFTVSNVRNYQSVCGMWESWATYNEQRDQEYLSTLS